MLKPKLCPTAGGRYLKHRTQLAASCVLGSVGAVPGTRPQDAARPEGEGTPCCGLEFKRLQQVPLRDNSKLQRTGGDCSRGRLPGTGVTTGGAASHGGLPEVTSLKTLH